MTHNLRTYIHGRGLQVQNMKSICVQNKKKAVESHLSAMRMPRYHYCYDDLSLQIFAKYLEKQNKRHVFSYSRILILGYKNNMHITKLKF